VQLEQIRNEVRVLRNLFSHRHQPGIQTKYVSSWCDLEVEKIRSWCNRFFELVRKGALIFDRSGYADLDVNFANEISDQIDLILFGSITHAVELFFEGHLDQTEYWVQREKFYSSPRFIETILAKGP
jgi:hypothetical protein